VRTQVAGYFGSGFPSGLGWCKQTYAAGEVFEGFLLNDQCQGFGCMTRSDGTYYSGQWKSDKLVHGIIHHKDGTLPLQFQSRRLRQESVNQIATELADAADMEQPQGLAKRIVNLNIGLIPELHESGKLRNHTILLLPPDLECLLSTTKLVDGYLHHSANPTGPFDQLVGTTVEVRICCV
jgi:hypothetical protein